MTTQAQSEDKKGVRCRKKKKKDRHHGRRPRPHPHHDMDPPRHHPHVRPHHDMDPPRHHPHVRPHEDVFDAPIYSFSPLPPTFFGNEATDLDIDIVGFDEKDDDVDCAIAVGLPSAMIDPFSEGVPGGPPPRYEGPGRLLDRDEPACAQVPWHKDESFVTIELDILTLGEGGTQTTVVTTNNVMTDSGMSTTESNVILNIPGNGDMKNGASPWMQLSQTSPFGTTFFYIEQGNVGNTNGNAALFASPTHGAETAAFAPSLAYNGGGHKRGERAECPLGAIIFIGCFVFLLTIVAVIFRSRRCRRHQAVGDVSSQPLPVQVAQKAPDTPVTAPSEASSVPIAIAVVGPRSEIQGVATKASP